MIFLLITRIFQSSNHRNRKGFVTFAKRTFKRIGAKQFGPWPWSAGEVAGQRARGAAWRCAGMPAEAAQEVVELHAQRVEAAERHGEVKPAAVKLTGDGIRGGGGLPWGRRKGAPQKGKWIEEGPRRLTTGASVGSLGQPLGRGTGGKGRRRRPLFLGSPRLKKLWVG